MAFFRQIFRNWIKPKQYKIWVGEKLSYHENNGGNTYKKTLLIL